jgi:hypothetical protein
MGADGKGGALVFSVEKAKKITEDAMVAADDVAKAQASDPLKKRKVISDATKAAIIPLVRSGDPRQVLEYIKKNRKEFVSGVYSTVFMSSIRKFIGEAGGGGGAGAGAAVSGGGGAEESSQESKKRKEADSKTGGVASKKAKAASVAGKAL